MLAGIAAGLAVGGAGFWVYRSAMDALGRVERLVGHLDDRVASVERRVEKIESASGAVRVYFTRTDARGEIVMEEVDRAARVRASTEEQLRAAMDALLAGPDPAETQDGSVYTQLPPGTRLLGARIEGETAYLDFSKELEQTAGTMRLAGMLRQIVWTATAVPPVRRVILLVEGERVGTEEHPFTGDGLLFDELARDALPL